MLFFSGKLQHQLKGEGKENRDAGLTVGTRRFKGVPKRENFILWMPVCALCYISTYLLLCPFLSFSFSADKLILLLCTVNLRQKKKKMTKSTGILNALTAFAVRAFMYARRTYQVSMYQVSNCLFDSWMDENWKINPRYILLNFWNILILVLFVSSFSKQNS